MATQTTHQLSRDTCWNCGSVLRLDQSVCVNCGASRVAGARQVHLATPSNGWYVTEDEHDLPRRYRPSGDLSYGSENAAPMSPVQTLHGDVISALPDASVYFEATQYIPGRPMDSISEEQLAGARQPRSRLTHPRGAHVERGRYSGVMARVVNVLFTIGFGLMGTVIGGGIWYAVVSMTHLELGPFGVLMGYLTGIGVTIGSNHRSHVPWLVSIILTYGGWIVVSSALLNEGVLFTPLDLAFLIASLLLTLVPLRSLPEREP